MSSNARAEYRKRTQQRQTVIFGSIIAVMTILLVLGTLVWSGLLPFPFNREFSQPDDTVAIPCPAENVAPADPTTISVNVYNSTTRSGLAGTVATALATSGVVVTETANWSGEEFNEPVRIYTSTSGVTNAYTLLAYFPDATVYIDPNMTSEVIEVVLGPDYTELVENPTEEQFISAMEPLPGCLPLSDFGG